MSCNLQSIMVELKNGTDAQDHVVDIASITRAVDGLEIFPMSMLQLQETRVAQLLQTIRHQVENPLQKRIRTVIKAWQKLLEPGSSCDTVIPLLNNSCNGPVAAKVSSTPNINDSSLSARSSNGRSNPRNHCITNHQHQEPSTKPLDHKKLSFSTATFPNGCSPRQPPTLNDRVCSLTSDAPKLAKVKSTAELIREAGGCIDSITKDRILSNRIAKESDEFPRLVPLAALRSSRKAKNPPASLTPSTPSQHKSTPRNFDCILPPPPALIPPSPQYALSVPPVKSELIAKFLKQSPTLIDSPWETHVTSDHNHHKEKGKHGKKRRKEDGERGIERVEDENVATVPNQPPVTNHVNDWPILPPLTEEVMRVAAETWLKDYHSDQTPSHSELQDLSRVGDLLQGTWEEVSASRDDCGCLKPMTALFSVDLGDDQLMHILPWTNLADYRQTFFPPGTTTTGDISRLVDLSEPW